MDREPFLTNIHFLILHLTATGSSVSEIKRVTGLKRHAFNRCWQEIFQFFGVNTKCGAICKAIEGGLLKITPVPLHPHMFPLEKKVLELLVHGLTTDEIALKLDMQPHHVRMCIFRVMERYQVHSREHLVAIIPKF